jgi:broad specificity phosphatase PhoE
VCRVGTRGFTDLPLTSNGHAAERLLGTRLRKIPFAQVYTSPLRRARRTCELAGLPIDAIVDGDLVVWDYGDYEGLRSDEIRAVRPGWYVFRDGCPGGEAPEDVLARALRVVERFRAVAGITAVLSSGHFLRVLGVCWLGLDARAGGRWMLDTASPSALGYEHDGDEPDIRSGMTPLTSPRSPETLSRIPHMEKSLPASNIPPSLLVLLLCDAQAALHPPFMHERKPKECFDD